MSGMVIHHETRAMIIRMTRYITDDSTIASYTGVPKSVVTRLRKVKWANGRVGDDGRTGAAYQSNAVSREPIGMDYETRHASMCKDGSERLLAALHKHHWQTRPQGQAL